MIIEILRHTPPWVFLLLIALVALGVRRLRASEMHPRQLLILPIAMTALSAFGLWQAFGPNVVAIVAWVVSFAVAVGVGRSLRPRAGVRLVQDGAVPGSTTASLPAMNRIHVPGSALPLILMMSIFFLRYGVAVSLAMDHSLRTQTVFVAIVGALYGLSSGAFAARALRTLRSASGRVEDRAFVVAAG